MRFIQARSFTPLVPPRRIIDLVVLHSMESGELGSTAENVATWFASPSAPKASAHFCVDSDSAIQCVRVGDIAWAAPGANSSGIQIEMAGRASQTQADWQDDYSLATIDNAARITAAICVRFFIPRMSIGIEGLKSKQRGIVTHASVSMAFKKSNHTDPGLGFPMQTLLDLVAKHMISMDPLGPLGAIV